MNREFQAFDIAGFLREATRFIDDLSNWYVRRNRRRFWRSRNAGDRDKLAAYQTLYTVLVTLTKLLAPVIPFMTERMYQNLVVSSPPLRKGRPGGVAPTDQATPDARATPPNPPFLRGGDGAESVHLCAYPQPDAALLDPQLSERMSVAQLVVNLGHGLREQANQRVRQPLAELRFAATDAKQRAAIENLAAVIQEELNVKKITTCDNLDDLVSYTYKPNLKTLGPKFGKGLGLINKALATIDPHIVAPLRRGEAVTLHLDGAHYLLNPEDVLVSTQQAADWVAADSSGIQIALSTTLTPELQREGMARDFVRQVQQLRKDADLEITDRIRVFYDTHNADVIAAVTEWNDYIREETLANSITKQSPPPPNTELAKLGEIKSPIHLPIWIEKA